MVLGVLNAYDFSFTKIPPVSMQKANGPVFGPPCTYLYLHVLAFNPARMTLFVTSDSERCPLP